MILNKAADACYYNLRKDIRKPQRYGEQVDQSEVQHSNSEESDVEVDETELGIRRSAENEKNKRKVKQ